jgi:hypothetical protein
MKIINKPPVDEKWIELTTAESEPLKNFPCILQEDNPEVLASLIAVHAKESGDNTEVVVAAPDISKGKRARTSTDSDVVKVKTKKLKVGAASIPKKRGGKGERVIIQEHLDEALEAIEKEEHEPKKKRAPLQIVSPMVEMTPILKRLANERASDIIADKKELKAQYIQQRDEKLKSLGLGDCDKFYKEKLAEIKEIAGKAAEDDVEEEMMIIVEDAPEVGTSEAIPQAVGPDSSSLQKSALQFK